MASWHAVGIDLGTTYSAVACIDESGHTAMVRSVEGDLLTPSVVLFEQDETIVGRDARKARGINTSSLAECVKRDMGQPVFSQQINGEQLPPEVIQGCILRKLRADAAAALGENIKVVITVPAFFDEPRRKKTADAGEMAGLDVLNIVNEPTAAALAFGERLGYLTELGAPKDEMRVLVYDLGGGTFDVTLIELKPGEIVTLATDGDVQLGGYDWDSRLADYVAGEFERQCRLDIRQDPAGFARLRGQVEEAKHTLTARSKATIRIDHEGRTAEILVTQQKFEELTEDLLERTAYTTRQVLSSTGLEWRDVSRVLLVGGSSRMPMVSKMLRRRTGITPDRSVNPDEAVARGAAIFADYLLSVQGENARAAQFSVVDVNSHSLGIEGVNRETLRKENVILIPRNTPLPKQVTRKFVTKEDNQQSVVVKVLEGESSSPDQCTTIGSAVIRDLPPGLNQGTRIEVVYRYASNGRLSVRARLPETGNETAIDLEREQGLSGAGVNRWKEVVTRDGGFGGFRAAIHSLRQEGEAGNGAPQHQVPSAPQAGESETKRDPSSGAPQPATREAPGASTASGAAAPTQPAAAPLSPAASGPGQGAEQAAASSSVPGRITPISPAGSSTEQGASGLTPMTPGDALASHPAKTASASPATQGAPGTPPPGATTPRPSFAERFSRPYDESEGEEVSTPAPKKDSGEVSWKTHLIGHVLASTIGLVVGYYILCLIRPEANFLNLPLPGVKRVEEQNSKNADRLPAKQPPNPNSETL